MKSRVLAWLILFIAGVCFGQEVETSVPTPEEAGALPVTLKQVVDLALKNNLDIQIENYNPEINDTRIKFEKSKFDPFFASVLNQRESTIPTGSALVGAEAVATKNFVYNFSWDQKLPTGTSYSLVFDNSRVDTNQLFTSVNPRYDSSLFASVTQPLMRGFGIDVTKTPTRIAEQDRLASDHRLRQRVLDTALAVEQAYWDLVFFRGQREVRKQALASAQDLYENNKKQVEVGTMAPLEIVVAEAEVAAREQDIITTENLIGNTEDKLRNLVTTEKQKDRWDTKFVPVENPVVAPLTITTDEAVAKALANNPDLKALESDLQSRDLNTKFYADATKPQLDFQASYGFSGIGGNILNLDDSVFPPVVIGTLPGGYGDAISSLFDNKTWAVGLVVGLPIRNRAAEADYVRADLQQQQTSKVLENTRQQLIFNIRMTIRNLESDLKSLESARASRILQEKKLDAEKKKLAVGLSTNHVVLDYQNDLALAQSEELFAKVDYQKNMAQLERYMGENLP